VRTNDDGRTEQDTKTKPRNTALSFPPSLTLAVQATLHIHSSGRISLVAHAHASLKSHIFGWARGLSCLPLPVATMALAVAISSAA